LLVDSKSVLAARLKRPAALLASLLLPSVSALSFFALSSFCCFSFFSFSSFSFLVFSFSAAAAVEAEDAAGVPVVVGASSCVDSPSLSPVDFLKKLSAGFWNISSRLTGVLPGSIRHQHTIRHTTRHDTQHDTTRSTRQSKKVY
jgi:hypothetical protein